MTEHVLSGVQHGKAEVRLVRIEREPGRPGTHSLHDLSVSTLLRGDFAAAYTDGDNAHVHTTDTQKNTVYALAREHGVGAPERFLGVLADHWSTQPWVTGTWFHAEAQAWDRLPDNGHSFVRAGGETRTAWVQTDGRDRFVLGGVRGLAVLKSTGSEFHGFPRDRYTTLAETDDRILATSIAATWRYATDTGAESGADTDAVHSAARTALVSAFADTHSLALQQSIHAMAGAVLDACPDLVEVRVSCPNLHHFLVDLEPFGLDNPGEVYVASDRPYGVIAATLSRAGTAAEPRAWVDVRA